MADEKIDLMSTLSSEENRLDTVKLEENGTVYKLGCTSEEALAIYNALVEDEQIISSSLNDINSRLSPIETDIVNKVDKEQGKGLSTNDYTTTEKTKLAGIEAGAEVNIQSDWNESNTNSDAFIKNKPNLATVATTGSYNDLTDTPNIGDIIDDIDNLKETVEDDELVVSAALNDLNSSIATKLDSETYNTDIASFVSSAEYVSTSSSHTINFKNKSGSVISSINANDFIKDGMVDTVSISNGNLVITFNTDSGKQPISIPLTDIFNPNNYYNKNEVYNKTEVDGNLSLKANTSDVYTKTEADDLLSAKSNVTDLNTEISARKAVDGQNGDTYAANDSSTYISDATSLNDADVKLDTALKNLKDEVIDNEEVVASALNDLEARKLNADVIWQGTEAEYNALTAEEKASIIAFISD